MKKPIRKKPKIEHGFPVNTAYTKIEALQLCKMYANDMVGLFNRVHDFDNADRNYCVIRCKRILFLIGAE